MTDQTQIHSSSTLSAEVMQAAFDHLLRLNETSDAAAKRALRAWLLVDPSHPLAWKKAQRAWRVGGAVPIGPVTRRMVLPRSRWRQAMAMAACLMLGFGVLLGWDRGDLTTASDEIREIGLEDGSHLTLDAGSVASTAFSSAHRAVVLRQGDAFFQIARDEHRPFDVVAGGVTVTVLGTSFDVRLDQASVQVQVVSGKVRLRGPHGETIGPLTAGQAVRIDRVSGQTSAFTISPADVAAWKEDRLVVEDRPLAEVVAVLNRHYPGRLVLTDDVLAARHVTGVFDLRQPVRALRAAVAPWGGEVSEWMGWLTVVRSRATTPAA